MPAKHPILSNKLKSESNSTENEPKTAHRSRQNAPKTAYSRDITTGSAPETPPNDAEDARNSRPLPQAGQGARRACPELAEGAGEGSVLNAPSNASSDAPAVVGASHETPSPKPALEQSEGSKRGPKTPRGKRAISRNAIKHAILSEHPVVIVGFETIEEWEEFEAEIVESWAPVGRYERELATDVAFGLWRLRRCRIHESASLSQQVEQEMKDLFEEANPDYDDDDDDEDGEGDSEDDEGAGDESVGAHGDAPARELVPVDPLALRAGQQLNII